MIREIFKGDHNAAAARKLRQKQISALSEALLSSLDLAVLVTTGSLLVNRLDGRSVELHITDTSNIISRLIDQSSDLVQVKGWLGLCVTMTSSLNRTGTSDTHHWLAREPTSRLNRTGTGKNHHWRGKGLSVLTNVIVITGWLCVTTTGSLNRTGTGKTHHLPS